MDDGRKRWHEDQDGKKGIPAPSERPAPTRTHPPPCTLPHRELFCGAMLSTVRVLWLMVFDVNDQNQSSWLGVKSRVLCDTHYNEPKTLSEIVHL